MKHTPAPWQTSLTDDTVVIHIGADGVHYEVATIDGDYNEPDLWPVMEANARLIAAAPDLLRELADLVDWLTTNQRTIEGEFDMAELLAPARAAIARATNQGADQ